eukprot:COSAG01_NODE_2668_length_7278_cov_187.051957_7_plen_202_part_00
MRSPVLPTCSTLITRAPRSQRMRLACGPANCRVRSTTTTFDKGPLRGIGEANIEVRWSGALVGLGCSWLRHSVTTAVLCCGRGLGLLLLAGCLAGCSCCDAAMRWLAAAASASAGGRPTCEAADYIRTLYCSQAGQSAKNCWLQKKPPCTERRVFGLSAHSHWKTLHTAHCCLASGRPMNYVKPSYPQRTAAEWRKFNAMK